MDKFAFIRLKNRHKWEEISVHVKNVLALANINDFPNVVKEKIFPRLLGIEIADLDDYWENWIDRKRNWFSSTIIPIDNEVVGVKHLFSVSKDTSCCRMKPS